MEVLESAVNEFIDAIGDTAKLVITASLWLHSAEMVYGVYVTVYGVYVQPRDYLYTKLDRVIHTVMQPPYHWFPFS